MQEKIVKTALEKGADEVIVKIIERDDVQLRFSNNMGDIANRWVSRNIMVFLALNGRTTGFEISRPENMEKEIEKGVEFAKKLPENPDFMGIYDGKLSPAGINFEPIDDELSEYGKIAMDSALSHKIKRVSGEIYLARHRIKIATNYNSAEEHRSYLITTARAFNHEGNPGQASTHIADKGDLKRYGPEFVGDKAGKLAEMNVNVKEGEEGNFTVLLDPLCFGSTITEVGSALSAFSVDSGMSFFVGKLGEKVASDVLTLYDDPHSPGSGMAGFDDEGKATQKTITIEKGVLKSYLHSTSTAKKYGVESTGNSKIGGGYFSPGGSIMPGFWQNRVEPGKRKMEDIMADIDRGLYIANTWYTRFQDRLKGDFSTIPRDGIFYIEDGEIKEAWKGIRISENILHMLENIRELSSELIPVDWWGETVRTFAPYALIDDVRITKAR